MSNNYTEEEIYKIKNKLFWKSGIIYFLFSVCVFILTLLLMLTNYYYMSDSIPVALLTAFTAFVINMLTQKHLINEITKHYKNEYDNLLKSVENIYYKKELAYRKDLTQKYKEKVNDLKVKENNYKQPIDEEYNKKCNELKIYKEKIQKDYKNRLKEFENKKQRLEKEYEAKNKKLKQEEIELKNNKDLFEKFYNEKNQQYPWLAKLYADYYISTKEPFPELKAYEDYEKDFFSKNKRDSKKFKCLELEKLNNSNKTLLEMNKKLEYQLEIYENTFVGLKTFREIPPMKTMWDELDKSLFKINKEVPYHTYLKIRSKDEYNLLSSKDRSEVDLKIYRNIQKTFEEKGLDYERYIGYLYEQKGYTVKYNGAIEKYKDMGRDLIAEKGNDIIIIQCKYWSTKSIVHEKHIFQLYGSKSHMQIEKPQKRIKAVFVTSAKVSEKAKECAEKLKIEVYENIPYNNDYPCIKCNISTKTKEKIYHLPIDKNYDEIIIERNKGEFYAETIDQAEKAGFRRAKILK